MPARHPGPRSSLPRALRDASADLVLGSACVGCARPGRVLCPACEASLPRRGRVAWPTPAPDGLALPYAGGEYAGLLRASVNAHKEHAVLALAAPLGRVLCAVLHDLLAARGDLPVPDRRVVLVPVPSRPPVVRRRGHDPLLRITREAAAALRRHGVPAEVRRVLALPHRVRDQSALGAAERAANLGGSMVCRRVPGPFPAAGLVVVVDDVLTTGATAREAQRALEDAGVEVGGVATIAATRRRHVPGATGAW